MTGHQDHFRIGTAEREQAIAELGKQFSAGRLAPDEFSLRCIAVGQAVVQGDLRPIFADLPVTLPLSAPWASKLEQAQIAAADEAVAKRARQEKTRRLVFVYGRLRVFAQFGATVCAVLALVSWLNGADLVARALFVSAVLMLAASPVTAALQNHFTRKR